MNKIKFGLRNVHYFPITESVNPVTGVWTTAYGASKAIKGAVNLSLDPVGGEKNDFFADDSVYATTQSSNKGYDGNLEIALLQDSDRAYFLGETVDNNGAVVETSEDKSRKFAMTFEIQGDVTKRKYILYNCEISKPSISAQTKEDSVEPATDSLAIQVRPRIDADHLIQTHTNEKMTAEIINGWDNSVYIPTSVPTPTYSEASPVGSENPSAEGWYYKDGNNYFLTSDETVVSGKTYYIQSVA